jgi:hypothetical protein
MTALTIYDRLWIERTVAATTANLRAPYRMCDTCPAVGRERCREGGKFVATHEGRAA